MENKKELKYARRLLKLADFLEKLPREKFDYATWSKAEGREEDRPPRGCGTTACALGWAVAHKDFKACARREGFTVGLKPSWLEFENRWVYDIVVNGKRLVSVDGHGLWGAEAASAILFGLSYKGHVELFIPRNRREEKVGPEYVAKKIRKFVSREYGKEVLNG